MGSPKRIRKKYITPKHPWQKGRIEEEIVLKREYGLKNKREIWKQSTIIKRFISNFKKPTQSEQAKKELQSMLDRMERLGIVKGAAGADEVLNLGIRSILERRLQTIVVRKSLARSMKQARQFIVHRHIAIGDQVITSPSYLVSVSEQQKITFIPKSALSDDQHPERATVEKAPEIAAPAEKPAENEVQETVKEAEQEEASPVIIKDAETDNEIAKAGSEAEEPVKESAEKPVEKTEEKKE